MERGDMDYQGTLNKVYHAIHAQGGPSVDDQGYCQYRGLNGRKCAAGQLITDDQYYDNDYCELEGKVVNEGTLIDELLIENGYTDLAFIKLLQVCHDQAESLSGDSADLFFEEFNKNIQSIAEDYNLTVPAIPS